MAQKLHDQYGFNYTNLKVLLGGWNTWKQMNSQDPTGYPIGSNPVTSTPKPGALGITDVKPAPQVTSTVVLVPAPVVATPKP